MGGNNLSNNPFVKHLERDVQLVAGFIALDGSSNVIGIAPTTAPVGTGPYTMCKGLAKAIGVAGAVIKQPHTATGTYVFTLDEAWMALLGARVTLLDPGAVALPAATVTANVMASTAVGPNGGYGNGVNPGTSASITAQTVNVFFRTVATGALIDPTVSTGFWLELLLKRSGVQA